MYPMDIHPLAALLVPAAIIRTDRTSDLTARALLRITGGQT